VDIDHARVHSEAPLERFVKAMDDAHRAGTPVVAPVDAGLPEPFPPLHPHPNLPVVLKIVKTVGAGGAPIVNGNFEVSLHRASFPVLSPCSI
jgi:hypothetical protein